MIEKWNQGPENDEKSESLTIDALGPNESRFRGR